MELAACLKRMSMKVLVERSPRPCNKEADSLAHGNHKVISPDLEIKVDPTTLPWDISPDALWQQIRRQERQRQEEPVRTELEDSEVARWKNVHALHASCEKGALLHLVEMMMSITYSSSGPLDRLQLRLSGYVSVVMFLVLACKCHFFPFHCGQVCFIVRCVFPGTPVGEFLHGAAQRACTREISQLGGARFHKGVTPPFSGQPLELALCGCFKACILSTSRSSVGG